MSYDFSFDWFTQNVPTWQDVILRSEQETPRKVLEIGSFEGRSTVWIIENWLAANGGEIFCVDTWQGGVEHNVLDMAQIEARFDRNIATARDKHPNTSAVKLKGASTDMLAGLVRDHAGTFDFIYVDGSHLAADVLSDLTLAFVLCRQNGLIVCDDYMWNFGDDPRNSPKLAVDSFTNCYSGRVRIILAWLYQIYMMKVAD